MSGKHLRSLDGLRGLAILLVVFYHNFPHRGFGFLGYLSSASWCGVDLFFVLSGFLITGILFESQGAQHFYRNFYMRRALRLFPIYIVFIAIVAIAPHRPTGHSWWIDIPYLLYASNIVLFFIPSFEFGLPLIIWHIWSLAVEEQFYLIWPWLLARLRTRQRILAACLLGSAAALILRVVLGHLPFASYMFLYLELPTRADSLLLGGAAAMLYRQPGFVQQRLSQIRILGIVAALLFVALALHAHTFFFGYRPINTWGFTLLAVASASLLLLATVPGSWTGHLLANPVLRFFGRYSYGLYLIHHLPAYYEYYVLTPFLAAHIHPPMLAATVDFLTVLGLSTGLAVLSFRFIERPFLKLKRNFPGGPKDPQVTRPAPAT